MRKVKLTLTTTSEKEAVRFLRANDMASVLFEIKFNAFSKFRDLVDSYNLDSQTIDFIELEIYKIMIQAEIDSSILEEDFFN